MLGFQAGGTAAAIAPYGDSARGIGHWGTATHLLLRLKRGRAAWLLVGSYSWDGALTGAQRSEGGHKQNR